MADLQDGNTNTFEKIDLREVLASKNPRLPKLIPGFIIRYLERIIHIEEINAFMAKHHNKQGLDFVRAVLEHFEVNLRFEGLDNIPREGRFIFASNHPLGGLDGLALMHAVSLRQKDVVFPVNDLLMNIPNVRSLMIPINKHGSNASNIRIIDDTFAGDRPILYFPAGLCSRKKGHQIVDLEWKKTFVSKAKQHRRDVIPVHINGKNSRFFYNLANLRVFLGIKTNIEMLYLPNEMFKQKDKNLVLKFGKPIPYTYFDKSKSDRDWSKFLKKKVYEMGQQQIQE